TESDEPRPRPSSARRMTVVETLYKNQQAPAAFMSADFLIGNPPPPETLNAAKMGFIGVAALVKLADIAPGAEPSALLAATESASTPEPAAAPTPKEDAPDDVAGQALSYEQMSGIVLIDGEGGTATGFM